MDVGRQQDVAVHRHLRVAAGVAYRQAAAAGVAGQQQRRLGVRPAHQAQEVVQVVLELADVVHVTAPHRVRAVAAQVRCVNAHVAAFRQAGGQRLQVAAVVAGAVQQHDHPRRVAAAGVFPVVQGRAVAGLVLVQRRRRCAAGDPIEIHAAVLLTPERRGEQEEQGAGQCRRPWRGAAGAPHKSLVVVRLVSALCVVIAVVARAGPFNPGSSPPGRH